MVQMNLPIPGSPWVVSQDGDADGRAMYRRHYSYRPYADGRDPALFVGPGGKLVLIAVNGKGLFVWRKFIDHADTGRGQQTGVCCAVFRNEGAGLSSTLILEAEPFALSKWPSEQRLYTYVDPGKVRRKRDPGRCFRRAGWTPCGMTKGGLLVLEKVLDEAACREERAWNETLDRVKGENVAGSVGDSQYNTGVTQRLMPYSHRPLTGRLPSHVALCDNLDPSGRAGGGLLSSEGKGAHGGA